MKTSLHATVTSWDECSGSFSPDIKGIGRKKFPFGVFIADSVVEHDPRWQNVTLRPFENSRIDEAVSNFCTRDQTSRTSYVGYEGIRIRGYVRPCVCVCWYRLTRRGSWRNREGIKEIGRGARDMHVKPYLSYWYQYPTTSSLCSSSVSVIPRWFFARVHPLWPENRAYPGIVAPLKLSSDGILIAPNDRRYSLLPFVSFAVHVWRLRARDIEEELRLLLRKFNVR